MKSLSDRAIIWPLLIAGFILFKSLVGNSSFLFDNKDMTTQDSTPNTQRVSHERSR